MSHEQLDRIEGKVDLLTDLVWNHKVISEQTFATKTEVRWAVGLLVTAGLSLGFLVV